MILAKRAVSVFRTAVNCAGEDVGDREYGAHCACVIVDEMNSASDIAIFDRRLFGLLVENESAQKTRLEGL